MSAPPSPIPAPSVTSPSGGSRVATVVLPIAIAVVALVLWNSAFLAPLRLFVVLVHEFSHAMAAWLSGGSVVRLELSAAEGGLCVTRGGSEFLILNAGYLGSLVWGALLLVVASRTRLDRMVVGLVGAVVLVTTLLLMRSGFGFAYGLAASALLLVSAKKLPEGFNDALLKTMGIVSCLYGVWDIGSDVLTRNIAGSDANALARLTGVPAMAWGILWIGLSLGICLWAVRTSARGSGRVRTGASST